jgi:hypothetical protein
VAEKRVNVKKPSQDVYFALLDFFSVAHFDF